ncbi:2-(1,2-epoxy-1,2-dihydrophenyl)acetyl-CoA isomerase [Jatrophihabitans sp. GAS493]|uniref:enoyl-CoA hydratase-related protein n=1 Tax=Jatrophihabitans sp. GAS493 TaxID=1907575 RepID=UPI000BB81C40|nr:enoyl-CoA hydratase-related protein [Jatrophihabitans sp. GAS493]SOD74635.1 2-(1,2-epoxy-1,2-dihydrophenyl)acetyl-CoA isomerase [Jatrophihabitans sp. GAS493]
MSDWQEIGSHPFLGVGLRDGAARVEFRRPAQLNAFDSELSVELLRVLRELGADDSVRSILITGAGRAFSAGADIKSEFGGESGPPPAGEIERGLREVSNTTIMVLREMPKPVVAAVNGAAAGIGCSLALACDLVVASQSAFFLLAFANLGLTADGGASLTVPARVGMGRAFVMALLAERVPAAEALSWGLADRVVADDELVGVTEELALRLAAGPTLSYAATKQLINRSALGGLSEQLDLEATLQGKMTATEDFAAATVAFTQKQRPTFTGR